LDAKLREQMRIEVKLLQQRLGIAVVFVTHDQVEALSLADRIIMMNQGDVQQEGSPKDIYENPKNPFVRDFMGKSIMIEAEIANTGSNGEIEVVKAGAKPVRFHTSSHHFDAPQAGQKCFIAIRSENIDVVPMDVGANSVIGENIPVFEGIIRTLLFIGDQYEAVIELGGGEKLHFYLPKKYDWHEGQNIMMRFSRGVSVWPE